MSIPAATLTPLRDLERALEHAGLAPSPERRVRARAARALAAANGTTAALRLLVADWTLDAIAAGRTPGELAASLRTAAERLADDPEELLFDACSRAVSSSDVRRLTPRVAVDMQLRALHAFAGLDGASLWLRDADGGLACAAATTAGARGRSAHAAARLALESGAADGVAVVHRFGKIAGALVADGVVTAATAAFVEETATALEFLVERDLLLERNVRRERALTGTLEARLLKHAFDLHDGPLQDLAALGSELALARRQIVPLVAPESEAAIDGRLDDLEARLHALDDALRATLQPLTATADESLGDAIGREVSRLRAGSRLDARVAVLGDVEILGDDERRAVVRVVQEALSNVLHHSRARGVVVSLERDDEGVVVTVADDGRGFDLRRALASVGARRRFGLVGMRERVRLLGGDLQIESAPGAGTRVSFVVRPHRPLGEAA